MLRKKLYKMLSGVLLCMALNILPVGAISIYNSVDDFVNKTYEVFLDRKPSTDEQGVKYWSYLIQNHQKSLYDYVVSLVSGEEFLKREITNEEFVDMLYMVLLDKTPDDEERSYWVGKINEQNEKLKDINKARIEVCKTMIKEPFFKEFADDLGVTHNFFDMNQYGISDMLKSYPQDKIDYVNEFYTGIESLGKTFEEKSLVTNETREIEDYIFSTLPVFIENNSGSKYEKLKRVSDENIERLVYALDYEISFPYDKDKSVYISPFVQMNKGERTNFVSLGIGITSRGLGKEITKAELVLGNEKIELEQKYKDQSKYDSKKISQHEFDFKIRSIDDLKLLDKMLTSDLTKIRFTFDDSTTYIYNLYEKDRVRNTLRFMGSLYTQIIVAYLFESKDIFDKNVLNGVN